jgi:hypothetical protein
LLFYISKDDKVKQADYARYMLHHVVPYLRQICDGEDSEKDLEARSKGNFMFIHFKQDSLSFIFLSLQ